MADQQSEFFTPFRWYRHAFFMPPVLLGNGKNRWFFMKLHKTRRNQRETYKYFDESGNVICEIKPGEKGVTEANIRTLHLMDDAEVRSNLKYRHGDLKEQKKLAEKWKQEYIEWFRKKYHRMPTEDEIAIAMEDSVPDNWIASIEEMTGDGDADGLGDKAGFLYTLDEHDKKLPADVERLNEIIAAMPKSWQEIYNMKMAGYNNNEIAKFRGVTEAAIRKTLDKIKKKIKNDEKLIKIYFTGAKSV
jgi:DNA-directed RNA polymerase specialized sigma24 family protein